MMHSKTERPMICGVVEGFYGRPWSFSQRKELYDRMRLLDMNTYLYAPKDDVKHRQIWRDLYSKDECLQLEVLINSAKENNIMFVYAISPGLDITFSNTVDVECLKNKMKQVMSLGCTAFALLFDDIDPNLNAVDKTKFESLASAQVSLTNELFEYLSEPSFFLFCPTEYCATRAVPSVYNSAYLNTIGEKLLPNIDIMWTGPKVISKSITVESIDELSIVLRRFPVIWDNIHANDYDQKRLFLGPYCGRSHTLLKRLRGVLTNPNCEFEANYIAVYTLADWFRLGCQMNNGEGKPYDPVVSLEDAFKSWIKHLNKVAIITENNERIQSKKSVAKALMATAVGSLPLSTASIAVAATQVLSHEACTAAVVAVAQNDSSTAAEVVSESVMEAQSAPSNQSNADAIATIENALADKDIAATALAVASVVTHAAEAEAAEICESETIQEILQQEMLHNIQDHEKNNMEDTPLVTMKRRESLDDYGSKMQLDESIHEPMEVANASETDASDNTEVLTIENLRLLVDLYYLPYEHGSQAVKLLELVHWLRCHAHLVDRDDIDDEITSKTENGQKSDVKIPIVGSPDNTDLKMSHWQLKAVEFHHRVDEVRELTNRFCSIPNKAVLSDFYSYLQDVRHVLETLDSYIRWLERAKVSYTNVCALRRMLSWCTPGYKEMFTGDDYESWMFRGGLIAEFQRMFPLDNAYDLFPIRASFIQCSPDFTVCSLLSDNSINDKNSQSVSQITYRSNKQTKPICSRPTMFTVRPYSETDRQSVYSLCFSLVNSRTSLSHSDYKSYSEDLYNLPGDRYVGFFLDFCPEYCLVIENDESVIVGYAVGSTSLIELNNYRHKVYLPKMRLKYSKYINALSNDDVMDASDTSDTCRSIIQNMINYFQRESSTLSHTDSSVLVHFDIKECCKLQDLDTIDSLTRKLLICLVSALKTSTAEASDFNYSASIISSSSIPNSPSVAIVTQATLITTSSVPLLTIGPVVQLAGKDRAPLLSLTMYAEIDSLNKSQRDVYKRYGFSEVVLQQSDESSVISDDNFFMSRIV